MASLHRLMGDCNSTFKNSPFPLKLARSCGCQLLSPEDGLLDARALNQLKQAGIEDAEHCGAITLFWLIFSLFPDLSSPHSAMAAKAPHDPEVPAGPSGPPPYWHGSRPHK
jgi:hypothetical protein